MNNPLMNPCGHLRHPRTGACIGFDSCTQQPPGKVEMERRSALVAEARELARNMGRPSEPVSLAYNLQVLVALAGQLERTTQALLKHRDLELLPHPEAQLRLMDEAESARSLRQWALSALAMANLPEGVRHG